MAGLITVWLECRNESLRLTIQDFLTAHRGFIIKESGSSSAVDMVCMEVDEINPERTLSSVKGLLEKNPSLEVFLTAGNLDSHTMLEGFRIGIKEFLPQPINRREFDTALSRLKERRKEKGLQNSGKSGKVVAFLGAKGGCGTSTLAVNMAMSLHQLKPEQQVALVDLNLHDSDLPLFLDLQPANGFRDLAADLSRLDSTFMQSLMSKQESNLHLLQSGFTGREGTSRDPIPNGAVVHALDVMKSMYDHVLVDCGHILGPETLEALDCASTVLLATTLNLPAIRRTKHFLQMMREAGFGDERIVIAVNRYQPSEKELLQHAEGLFEHQVNWLIPNDYQLANSSLNCGVPLVVQSPRAPLTQWYLSQAALLAGDKPKESASQGLEQKGSLFSRYWGGLTFAQKART